MSDLVASAKPIKPIRKENLEVERYCLQKEFEQIVSINCQNISEEVESAQAYIKKRLPEAADEICGQTQAGCSLHKETWWQNNVVDNAKKEKRKAWKQ